MIYRSLYRNLPVALCFTVFAAFTLGAFGLAIAADYPERDITVSVHTAPGGGTDTMARVVWKHAERLSGTHFVIENNPGAGGQIGFTKLALAKPDGYFVGAITTLSITTHELTRKGVIYSLKKSFRPIARIVLDPSVVVVRADSPFKTLADLIEAAKKIQEISPGEAHSSMVPIMFITSCLSVPQVPKCNMSRLTVERIDVQHCSEDTST